MELGHEGSELKTMVLTVVGNSFRSPPSISEKSDSHISADCCNRYLPIFLIVSSVELVSEALMREEILIFIVFLFYTSQNINQLFLM